MARARAGATEALSSGAEPCGLFERPHRTAPHSEAVLMPEKDYYQILGLSPNASEEEIRAAYRRLAKKYHPDRNKGSRAAEERFKEIAEAYSVLGDKAKRERYDRLKEAGRRGGWGFEDLFGAGAGGGPRPGGQEFRFEDLGAFGDLFSKVFGGGAGPESRFATRRRGNDIYSQVSIPFEVAARGGRVTVRVPRQVACVRCKGTGAAPGTQVRTCPQCGGRGQVSTGLGGFSMQRPCPQCFGRGRVIPRPCAACGGSGTSERLSGVDVTIPRGIGDGQKLRLAGLGQPGAGEGPPGDLILEVRVGSHPRFRRQGLNVSSTVRIDMVDAALGTTMDVQTMGGLVSVKVPPGVQPGQKLRLRGRGLEGADGRRGDHFVQIEVEIPRRLTERQKELLRELGRMRAGAKK